jgi:ketosteroid isomerase-like protein
MVSRTALGELTAAYREWHKSKAANAGQFIDLMAEDFTMGSLSAGAAGMRFSRDHVSREQARRYFTEMLNDWDLKFHYVRDYVAQGSEVAVICECCWLHNKTKRIVHSPKLDLWKFKGREAIGYFEFFDTDQAISAVTNSGVGLRAEPHPLYSANRPVLHDSLDDTARSNIRRMRNFIKCYDETKGGNYNELIAMLAPTVTWTSLADGADGVPFTSMRTSSNDVEAFFQALFSDWEMLRFDMGELICGGPYVVAHGRVEFRNKRTNKVFTSPKVDVFRFAKDRMADFKEYYDTAGAIRAATG